MIIVITDSSISWPDIFFHPGPLPIINSVASSSNGQFSLPPLTLPPLTLPLLPRSVSQIPNESCPLTLPLTSLFSWFNHFPVPHSSFAPQGLQLKSPIFLNCLMRTLMMWSLPTLMTFFFILSFVTVPLPKQTKTDKQKNPLHFIDTTLLHTSMFSSLPSPCMCSSLCLGYPFSLHVLHSFTNSYSSSQSWIKCHFLRKLSLNF